MPIQVIKEKSAIHGEGVTIDEIKQLVSNYRKNFGKKEAGSFRELDRRFDSRCVSYTMEEVQQLLDKNGYKPGNAGYELRIYFGSHGTSEIELSAMGVPKDKIKYYLGQQTAILVLAEPVEDLNITPLDCLKEGNQVIIGGIAPGDGLEVGTLCPPACNGHLID